MCDIELMYKTEYIDISERTGCKLIVMQFDGWIYGKRPYTFHGCPYWRVESTTRVMLREEFEERIRESTPQQYAWENQANSEANQRYMRKTARNETWEAIQSPKTFTYNSREK